MRRALAHPAPTVLPAAPSKRRSHTMQILSLCARRTVAMEPQQRTNTTRPMFSQHLPPHGLRPQRRPSPPGLCPASLLRGPSAVPFSRCVKWSWASPGKGQKQWQPRGPGGGMEFSIWMAQGKGEDSSRDAQGASEGGLQGEAHPRHLHQGEAKGQRPAELEKSRSLLSMTLSSS